jgi:catechol 2,3-dioxygenase-like lactoylglutathione lyase family enzyme
MKGKEKLKLPKLSQVGIVVRDIDETIGYYKDAFGIGPWAVFTGEPAECIERGKRITFKGKMAMAQVGQVELELIQILEGRSFHSDFLEERGEGIHHIGFFVNNFEERMAAVRDAGIEVLHQGLLKQMGLTIKYAYLDTTATGGVIIELIEQRFLGLPMVARSLLLPLGAKLAAKIHR